MSKRIRAAAGTALILCGVSAIALFKSWQTALSGFSPDGSVTGYSWMLLRIMLMSLIVPGIVLLTPNVWIVLVAHIHQWLKKQSVTDFLFYTLAVALTLRIIAVLILPVRLISDFRAYDELAVLLVTHGEYTDGYHPTAYFPPGWPFFLSLIYRLFGHHPSLGFAANVLFGVASVYLTWSLVRKVWGELPARWAACIVAILPSEVLFSNILGSEGLFTTLLLSALLLLLTMPQKGRGLGSVVRVMLGGILLGLATLTRSLTLLFPAVLSVVYLIQWRLSRRTMLYSLTCVVGMLLVVTPWIIRNKTQVGRATISTNSGVNLHVGNNPNAGVAFSMPDSSIIFLQSAANEAHNDSAGFASGIQYIRDHPIAFLVRGVLKSTFLMTSDTDALYAEIGAAADVGQFTRYCWMALAMQACWMVFLIGIGMGVHGYLRASPLRDAGGAMLLGVVLYWIAIHFVYFGLGRFHMPIVPLFAAFAGLAATSSAEGEAVQASGPAAHNS